MYIKQLVSMMAGHHFRGSIENTPDGEVAVVQTKDVAPEGGLNDANLYRVHVAGRKKPDYLQRDDILFIGRGNRIYAVLVDRDLDSTVAGSHFLFCG